MICPQCKKESSSVHQRANSYRQDVGNEAGATWVACDECDYQNKMDI